MCAAFLTRTDLPNVADMSIDTQLKAAGRCRRLRTLHSDATVCTRGSVSYRSVRAKPLVRR